MSQVTSRSKQYRRVFFFVLFFTSAAASFNGFYSKWHFREAGTTQFNAPVSFEAMIDGTANRPFVYRQLIPAFANWVDSCASEQTKDAIFAARSSTGIAVLNYIFDSPITGDRNHLFRYTLVYFTVAFFSWVAMCATYLAARSAGYLPVPAAFGSVAVMLLMPYFLTVGGYFYDYPELAFFALSVWMSINFAWWWMIPLVVLGTWNKESFLLFLPTLYPFFRLRTSRRNSGIGIIVLGMISALVYYLIKSRYQHNPGASLETHVGLQIKYLLNPVAWFSTDVTYGEVVFRGMNPFAVAVIVGCFWLGWRHLSTAVKRHVQIAAITNVPLYLAFCFPGEIRNLSMMYISFLFLLAANLTVWIREETGTPSNATDRII